MLNIPRSIKWTLTGLILTLTIGCANINCVPRVAPEQLPEHVSAMGVKPTPEMILVDTKKQTLAVLQNGKIKKTYTISTSNRGLGQVANTYKTPLGLHRINEKIGKGVPRYGIFNRRHYIGTIWQKQPRDQHRKDYISTRILRLEGLQDGFNKGRNRWGKVVDTEERAVYIHGTTMEWKLGEPSTKGCVHMSAEDVIHLFNEVPEGTLVWIN